jgi:hypothetical protein
MGSLCDLYLIIPGSGITDSKAMGKLSEREGRGDVDRESFVDQKTWSIGGKWAQGEAGHASGFCHETPGVSPACVRTQHAQNDRQAQADSGQQFSDGGRQKYMFGRVYRSFGGVGALGRSGRGVLADVAEKRKRRLFVPFRICKWAYRPPFSISAHEEQRGGKMGKGFITTCVTQGLRST